MSMPVAADPGVRRIQATSRATENTDPATFLRHVQTITRDKPL